MQRIASIIAATLAFSATPAIAASDTYLKLDTVEGEARTIDVHSWSWGASNAGRSATPAAEPAATDGVLTIVSPRDPASGQASGKRSHCPAGNHFPSAVLVLKREAYKLTDVTVTTCDAAGAAFTYHKIEIENAQAGRLKSTKTRSNIQNN